MDQLDLFDAPYVAGSATSKAAAEAIEPKSGTLRHQVWVLIRSMRDTGATDEECQQLLHMNPSTQRPRRIELEKAGLVIKTEQVRKTRSGRDAAVYVAREYNETSLGKSPA